jgi:hypothetical protein
MNALEQREQILGKQLETEFDRLIGNPQIVQIVIAAIEQAVAQRPTSEFAKTYREGKGAASVSGAPGTQGSGLPQNQIVPTPIPPVQQPSPFQSPQVGNPSAPPGFPNRQNRSLNPQNRGASAPNHRRPGTPRSRMNPGMDR